MSANPEKMAVSGKVGGHMVHNMIAEMEQKLAAGQHIDAGPATPGEAQHLQEIKAANAASSHPVQRNSSK